MGLAPSSIENMRQYVMMSSSRRGARQCLEKRKEAVQCGVTLELQNFYPFDTQRLYINAASLTQILFFFYSFILSPLLMFAYMGHKIFVYLFLFITLFSVVSALPRPNIDDLITQSSHQEQASNFALPFNVAYIT
jgi:hypothetical protein